MLASLASRARSLYSIRFLNSNELLSCCAGGNKTSDCYLGHAFRTFVEPRGTNRPNAPCPVPDQGAPAKDLTDPSDHSGVTIKNKAYLRFSIGTGSTGSGNGNRNILE